MKTDRGTDFPSNGAGRTGARAAAARIYGADERTTDPDFDFLQLARILFCRRKLIVTITAVGVMAAAFVGLLIAPKYTATARLVVEPSEATNGGGDGALPAGQLVTEIDTHVTRLGSRDYLRRVLDSLSGIPETGPVPETAAYEKLGPATTREAGLGLAELAHRLNIWASALLSRGPDRELDELERGLRVIQERASRIISVSFTAKSAERAAAVANRVVQLYLNSLVEQKSAQAKQELSVLNARAARLKGELDRNAEAMGALLSQPSPDPAHADDAKARDARLNALRREAASASQAYAEILERADLVRSQQEVGVPWVRVLSLASPPGRPSSVNPMLFTFPALIASLIAASLLAIILERVERPLRSEQDVRDALGLPCIGSVPRLPRSYADRPFHYLQKEPFTPFADSIRSALAALDLAQPSHKPITVLISSSVQGEGKTTVAASLGVHAASLGRRVLLIDFDLRRPSIMRILRGASQTSASQLQDRPLDEFIQHLADLHLDYLAMPQGRVDPAAPFIGKHVQNFLRGLGNCYDCVFIDAPPLLGITETRLLAGLVDSVIFVVKWGATRREVVQNAASLLRNALRSNQNDVVQASALVTQVDPRMHADYRYGQVGDADGIYVKHDFGAAPVNAITDGSRTGDEECEARAVHECAQ